MEIEFTKGFITLIAGISGCVLSFSALVIYNLLSVKKARKLLKKIYGEMD